MVHRDLKPANILVTKSGIKLLDFGLAKKESPIQVATDATLRHDAGRHHHGHAAVHVAGAGRRRGHRCRSDIFSFGAVLYEMVTGKKAFDGASPGSIIASILKDQPQPIAELCPGTPKGIRSDRADVSGEGPGSAISVGPGHQARARLGDG